MKKQTTIISFLLAFLLMVTLSACSNKENVEKIPNIDSLVDAKLEQRLNEAAIEQRIEQKIADGDIEVSEEIEENDVEEDDWEDSDLDEMEGNIGPYSITMQLHDLSDVDEGDFVGYYYYNERPQSKFSLKVVKMEAINTKGSMQLIMKEYTPQGTHSGTFNGQYECRGYYYKGTFTNSKGQKFDFKVN